MLKEMYVVRAGGIYINLVVNAIFRSDRLQEVFVINSLARAKEVADQFGGMVYELGLVEEGSLEWPRGH